MHLLPPVVEEINYCKEDLSSLEFEIESESKKKFLFEYPTVYIINDNFNKEYSVYVGETADIKRRTLEHFNVDSQQRSDWKNFAESKSSKMFIIAHNHFNKSLTLDIENRLMQYLMSSEMVSHINNRRLNPQNEYYTSNELEKIFSKVWKELHNHNKELFPVESVIRDSAIFKASPFHKLTEEQNLAKDKIILKITEAVNRNKSGQLIFVEGDAGSGKTVLMSNLFYELNQLSLSNSENEVLHGISSYLLVNHDQQLTVYEQIVSKLGFLDHPIIDNVSKPTRFINNHSVNGDKADVVLVDEAHLLLTRGKQAYQGKNQLEDLLERSKVVVAIFDRNQILAGEQFWEEEELLIKIHETNLNNNYIHLENQMRINADQATVSWIRNLIDNQTIDNIPHDSRKYDLKIFDSPSEMYEEIKIKSIDESSGISRMIATFDWEYVDNKKPNNDDMWRVKIGNWNLPWNLQIKQSKEQKRKNKHKSWAEQEHTIDEVGSTYTIQGFDLNYAGVIIGPSVKYRNGKIIFDSNATKNKKVTNKRTLKSGEKINIAEFLLKNELNVLLTRGVNGLYIYAVDDELRKVLKLAKEGLIVEENE